MATHKIQSAGGSTGLDIHLEGVPKILKYVTSVWAPAAFTISFKLETDENILLQKAQGAIDKYSVDLVVANLLQTRYSEVRLITGTQDVSVKKLECSPRIERELVRAVAERHDLFVASSKG
mmetsp:Transcript_17051/g.23954  ORF Transcript_17051/g.23954 Transcript_17051/m.23954 type:complete len:121 (-) Transcript_17051:31-393(-)